MTGARLVLALLVAALVWTGADASAETAREILDRRKQLDDGERHWQDREQEIELRITASRGGERRRTLTVYERQLEDDERQSILFFSEPAEVRGTGFLSFSHTGEPADQWLYLPALKRIRQITAQSRQESFVGTDLSYHDLDLIQEMPSWTETDAASSLLRDETLGDVPVHVIEQRPKRDDIAYERIRIWLGRDDLVSRRIELFDAKDDPVKVIVQSDIRFHGKIPVPHRVEVTRPRRGSTSVMEIASVTFDQSLEPDLFTQRALERGER